jgi:hypothetical protein
LRKNDWLQIALGLGGAGVGAGFAGYGPLAGLLGKGVPTAAAAAGASGIPGGAEGAWQAFGAPSATQTGLLSLGASAPATSPVGMGGGTASMFGAPPGQLSTTLTAPATQMAGAELGSNLDGAKAGFWPTLQGSLGNGKAAQFLGAMSQAAKSDPPPAPQMEQRLGLGGTKQLSAITPYGATGGPYGATGVPYGGGTGIAYGGAMAAAASQDQMGTLASLSPDQLWRLMRQRQGGNLNG